MNRVWGFALIALVAAGCRNQNPYAMFGPQTVPPPGMTTPPPAGYYPPPTTPPGLPATTVPANSLPSADFRPSLSSVPPRPVGDTPRTTLPPPPKSTATLTTPTTTSFASRDNFSAETPIKVVEATPSAAASQRASVLPFREPAPPSVVQATPAVPFNAMVPAVEMSQLPRPGIHAPAGSSPPLNKTRGYIPAQPQGSYAPRPASGSFYTDRAVQPAGYIEAVPADSEWRSR